MSSFNNNLDLFLTACRETAIEELKANDCYTERRNAQSALRSRLDAIINPEAQKILEEYIENTTDVQRMEANRILLCGITVSAEIQKRFDASTPEYKTFAKEYL